MKTHDYGKAILLGLVLVCVTVLGAVNVLEGGAVQAVLFSVLGYLTGNGVLAVKGQAPSPVITSQHRPSDSTPPQRKTLPPEMDAPRPSSRIPKAGEPL